MTKTNENSDEFEAKHSRVRGVRRERQATRIKRNQLGGAAGSKPKRNIVVQGQPRDQPDVRRIARVVLRLAATENVARPDSPPAGAESSDD